ncbi:hypothetical protein BUALT_Bualt04G0115500 [Buddleja alternifolia]|uniref:Uncharacterized protein n=1 Tax=Buddleja alternifolia TaxID=168488 RepID=A0AAV6XPG5_9LAMI|nr:hypothetical protein BUALT_Bualt04G0115500 [Buddleja alternifolia]
MPGIDHIYLERSHFPILAGVAWRIKMSSQGAGTQFAASADLMTGLVDDLYKIHVASCRDRTMAGKSFAIRCLFGTSAAPTFSPPHYFETKDEVGKTRTFEFLLMKGLLQTIQ